MPKLRQFLTFDGAFDRSECLAKDGRNQIENEATHEPGHSESHFVLLGNVVKGGVSLNCRLPGVGEVIQRQRSPGHTGRVVQSDRWSGKVFLTGRKNYGP